ncbi:cobalt-zinc-cadmium efflux system outer membrane protein [Sphingobium boeckii]|uniref:Cobalt-zinc-cadmium efflux system outer membrane protein n=1 Tax=Sphingobium boeckii TaxID=1082345 RepID=A0A7W9ED59_9SPHN|nr:TolC family protein [Sphingobium boeckii]MBB5684948.1 cobalt-zinc-cadmium efflux system outer membrane protein [Sphingobium boeckii]
MTDALSRVASVDPSIAVRAAQQQAAEASIRQADVRPRDLIGVDAEDFAGTGPYSPVDRSQTTAWYERTWERGGKREARIGAARSELEVAQQRGRLRMLDLLAQVQSAWVDMLSAEAAVPVAKERLAVAERLEREVTRRVGRALDPLFAGERARTSVAQSRIALDQAIETARIARASLAAFWGGGPDFRVNGSAFLAVSAESTGDASIVDLALIEAEREAADARIRLVEANSVADPTVRAGVRHFGQGNEVALVVGGSIPLGGRQANRGNVERAQAERLAAEAELAVMRVERKREIDRLVAQRAAIASEIGRIDRELLPSAERAVVLVRDGFNRGGTAFTFLEVAQAQQAVIDARTRRVELFRRYHLDGVRLDRLTGRHASLIASAENR